MKVVAAFFLTTIFLSAAHITLTPIAEELVRPVDLQVAPGDDDHLFIVEQNGIVLALEKASGKTIETVLNLTGHVSRGGNEEGLLGLAFSPDYENDSLIYLYYTKGKKNRITHISRFKMNGLIANRESEEILFTFKQDFGNHNGGWIAFGADKHLYLGVGDGGAANDPKRRAQDLSNVLGSILRLDVSGKKAKVPRDNPFVKKPDAQPEIYAYGLRNPWRCSFDQKTGNLWIADVGQNHWEEINFLKPGELKGKNFGWRPREGNHKTPKEGIGGEAPAAEHKPIYEYSHDIKKPTGGLSITGGYVHRGKRADLNGHYFFGDFVSLRLWSFREENGKVVDFTHHHKTMKLPEGKKLGPISSFGQDHDGEVYVLDLGGSIYRID